MNSPHRHFLYGTILIIITTLIGISGYRIAGWSVLDATYMAIITLFGVGYGEVHELSTELQYFTIAYIITGCTCLIYTVGAFINWLTEGQLQQLLGKRKMDKSISKLNEHIVICGYGRMGRLLANRLKAAGKAFLIIDNNDRRIEMIRENGYLFIQGDATEESVLKRARVNQASVVATVLPNDAANVFIVLSCRAINPKLTLISRANQISSESKLIQAGVDKVVMPAAIGADRMANMLLNPNAREILERNLKDNTFIDELGEIGLGLEEIEIRDPTLIGCKLNEIVSKEKHSFIIVAVRGKTGETILNPETNLILKEGDSLIVMNHTGQHPQLTGKAKKQITDSLV